MNKIYKVVWNTVRNCYVVGSELISSKSGRHSTSNGKSSSLKVTLTVLALCGMTALGSGVAPAYAADAGAAVESQYVAVLVNKNNNYYTSWGRQVQYGDTRTFNGHSYHKETVSGETYWVRDGYTIKYEENKRYPGALKNNIIKAYKTDSYTASSDVGLLKSNQIMVESAGVSTLTGVDLDDVSGGTYVGATNAGGTSTPSRFNYMIKDDNGRYVDAGNANFGERFKVATKHKDGTYSYNGEVLSNDNLYVVDNKVGVFLTSSGKVYTGKVFGAYNEVLMTTKSDEGTMYSYWGADTPDPNTKLADMTIGQFNQALEKVNNNSKAVAGDTIKEIKTTAKTDGGTIDLVRRGQYNSATGQYEGEHKVGSGITITSHGGTNGEDVKINFSNGTTGFDVAAGSKVEAVGTKEATTGLKINGETYNISGTDYRVVANPAEGSKGIYKPDASGKIELTVQDAKTGATSKVQLSDVASATTVNNNYTTLDTKIDKTKTDITNAYTTTINETKNTITNEYKKYVSDTEDYVTSGSISGDTITLKRALGGEVAITGLKDYVEGLDSYVTSASLKDNKLTITQNNGKGNYEIDLSGFADQFSGTDYRVVANPAEGSKGIYKPDASGKIELTVQDAKTGATSKVQLSDIASATTVTNNYNTLNTKVDAAKTTLADGKNTTVEASTAEDGHTEYKVNLNENVKLGDTIQLNGSDGSISATSGTSSLNFNNKGLSLSNGKNSTVINGGTITVNGGESVISGTQATFGKIKLNAESGSTITGLSNTTTKYDGFATAGRAATEEQLKEVAGKAGEAVETAGKGWNLTTNGAATSKTNIAPDGTVDFSSSNDNLVISNAGANLSFSLSDNLDLTNNKDKKGSVKVGENTALSNELLQVGKDVSLTASALNVGNSSLTTSTLMVGGLTYISSSGLDSNNRVISNVAAGKAKTDAVNVGQLESAIRGSQVSIKAGDGISVNKAGNQYTINVNIEGLSNEHGTVHVSTDSDPSVVSKSTLTESETITPAPAKRMNSLLLAEEAVAAEPENGSSTGKKMYVKYTSNAVKLITDDITDPTKVAELNDGEEIFFSGDGNITTTTEPATDGKNTETIRFSLNKDVKVDSIEAKSGNQINIKSEVNMKSQKITNLADGEIAEGSKDAVNGGQIYNLKQNVSTNTENINILNEAVVANAENINSLSHSLNKLDSRINRVGAGAAALAALHPLDFDPDNKWDFAAGYGNYAGANAVAIGTYYRPNENTMFSIGGSFGGGENMINAGVSFKLGSGGSGITTSKTVMAKKIKEQDELLKAQDAKMKEQDEKIAKLEALVAQQGEMIQQALGKK